MQIGKVRRGAEKRSKGGRGGADKDKIINKRRRGRRGRGCDRIKDRRRGEEEEQERKS